MLASFATNGSKSSGVWRKKYNCSV